MGLDARAHLDLLDLDGLLLLAGLGGLLLRLILVFAVVEDLADGGLGIGRNLDQVEARLLGARDGILDADGTDVVAFDVDKLNFAGLDPFIDAGPFACGCGSSPNWSARYVRSPLAAKKHDFLPPARATSSARGPRSGSRQTCP